MVKHIVMWTFRPEVDKAETVAQLQKTFAGFEQKVPGLLKLEVFGGFNGYDAVLLSDHEDKVALEAYQNHPAHLEAKQFVHSVIHQRAACDYEV